MFKELCRLLEIKKMCTSIRNRRCNGQVERFNRTLLNMIKMYLKGEQENWDLNLGCLASAYRATPQAATGLTPNLLILGQEVRLPTEVVYGGISNHGNRITTYEKYVDDLRSHMLKAHCIAREHLRKHAMRNKEIYDTKLHIHNHCTGDVVWYLNEVQNEGISPKLQPTYLGPCLIVRKLNDLIFEIQLSRNGKTRVVHHNKLKPFEGEAYPKWIDVCKATQKPKSV